ncbi:MAG: T9SS type A sorting domain-containing protein [Bacteroidia bacterium]
MKKLLGISCILYCLCLLSQVNAQPGIAGGYIDYFCVGQDSFSISLHILAECNSSLTFSKTLTATPECSSASPVSIQLALQDSADRTRTQNCEGVCNRCIDTSCTEPFAFSEYRFKGIIDLSQQVCDKWTFSWQESQRFAEITTGPANEGIYLYATIDKSVAPCNSTSTLSPFENTINCAGKCLSFYNNALDPDGDSLVYSIVSAKSSPTQDVTYLSPYSAERPLYFNGFPKTDLLYHPPLCRGFHLDSTSGGLHFRPMQAQVTIISYKIEEYRNNIKVGERVRDLMVVMENCESNEPPTLSEKNFNNYVCSGQNISFTIHSDDQDNDSVKLTWDGGIPGANFTVGMGRTPTATFSWTPRDSDISVVPYVFKVQASDNACPLPEHTEKTYPITVRHTPTADYAVTNLGMGLYEFAITRIDPASASMQWSGDDSISSNYPKFTHQFSQEDTVEFELALGGYCHNIYKDTLIVEFTVGMNEPLTSNPNIRLFPNPAKGHAVLLFDKDGFAPTEVELISPEGKIVGKWKQDNPGELRIERDGLASGIYLLRLQNNRGQSWQSKLIFE